MRKIYLIALIAAIIAGFATYLFAEDIRASKTMEGIAHRDVVVALVDISEDTVLTADMLEVKSLPTVSVAADAAYTINELVGRVTLYPITTGETILTSRVSLVGTENADSGRLSFNLKSGQCAYTISVDTLTGIAGFIKAGDFVDIYDTYTVTDNTLQEEQPTNSAGRVLKSGETAVKLLLHNVRILKLSTNDANLAAKANGVEITAYDNVTLLLEDQKMVYQLAEAVSMGNLRLVLVSYADGAGIADDLKNNPAITEDASGEDITSAFGTANQKTTTADTTKQGG